MQRIFNFSAGPAALPTEVLEQAQRELLDFQNSGMSIMEVSHRGKLFMAVAEQVEADFRRLAGVPDHYKVLFMQGGATGQFSIVPMNLLSPGTSADYLHSGHWAEKAIKSARRYGAVNVVASAEAHNFQDFPPSTAWQLNPQAAYCHYVANETIGGLEFQQIPEVGAVPLVADMSSNILSRPFDVNRYGLIYAGAQKNLGPAGLTVVIVREDLLGRALPITPEVFDYAAVAKQNSMLNTPPTFAWYLLGLVLQWLERQGGLSAMAVRNQQKAARLYQAIDDSAGFYSNHIAVNYRSRMNVPFFLADSNLQELFLSEAKAAGLDGLKGHKALGGLRASIYNAMPVAGVDALIAFMGDFMRRHG